MPLRFDLILLTAVWMHLDMVERTAAMAALANLIAPSGVVAMSLRHGPVPSGRRMFDVCGDETAALGATHGLHAIFLERHDDGAPARADVTWTRLVLEAAEAKALAPATGRPT